MHERILGYASLLVGLVATIAAGVQTYVAWAGREDFRRSIFLTEVVERCSRVMADTTLKTPTPQEIVALLAELQWLQLVAKPVDAEVRRELEEAARQMGSIGFSFDQAGQLLSVSGDNKELFYKTHHAMLRACIALTEKDLRR